MLPLGGSAVVTLVFSSEPAPGPPFHPIRQSNRCTIDAILQMFMTAAPLSRRLLRTIAISGVLLHKLISLNLNRHRRRGDATGLGRCGFPRPRQVGLEVL